MKKILSVVLALAMVLALGVTAFAANVVPATIEEGKTVSVKIENLDTKTYTVTVADQNGFLTIGNVVVDSGKVDGFIAFELTAPAGTAGKLGNIVITSTPTEEADDDLEVAYTNYPVYVEGEVEEDEEDPTIVEKFENLDLEASTITNTAVAYLGKDEVGISADVYNTLKNRNYESITFVLDNGASWTITRGDYTKMNVTADILFGVDVDTKLWTVDKKDNVVEDKIAENAVLKALGSTQADVFYVTIADNCNIANVASKPALVIDVNPGWINFSNKFSVNCYKFDGENVKEIAKGLAVKPQTNKLTLNLTAGGVYVFVADNYTVNPTPSTPTEKPNASTGANSAAAVVALAVMAVAAVASKKIVK